MDVGAEGGIEVGKGLRTTGAQGIANYKMVVANFELGGEIGGAEVRGMGSFDGD